MLSLKIPEFCSVDGAKSKNSVFRVFRVPFDCPAHSLQETVLPKPMVPMESRDSEGVPFASLESL